MGSNPVTATISSPPSRPPASVAPTSERLVRDLEEFFGRREPPSGHRNRLVVAFSGGPDSTALLLGLRQATLAVELVAVHVDHGLDPGSAERAGKARDLAARLGVDLRIRSGRVSEETVENEGLESAARSLRYRLLETERLECGAAWIATAHHRDDQIETVLLRMSRGTGLRGLPAMAAERDVLLRPLLSWSRSELAEIVDRAGLDPVRDPGNRDPERPRNLLRHRLLPRHPEWREPTLGVARAAAGLRRELDRRMEPLLDLSRKSPGLDLAGFLELPPILRSWALSLLHRSRGLPHSPPETAVAELERQISSRDRIGVDCGNGWRWMIRGDRLLLERPPAPVPPFAYTFEVPGEVELPEVRSRMSIARRPTADWMWEGRPDRAALRLPVEDGDLLRIRNRRPGDRLRPLGAGYERRLKEILIDRKIPRRRRDRLPLLCLGERIAWIPGVTIHHDFRLREEDRAAWVAELEPTS